MRNATDMTTGTTPTAYKAEREEACFRALASALAQLETVSRCERYALQAGATDKGLRMLQEFVNFVHGLEVHERPEWRTAHEARAAAQAARADAGLQQFLQELKAGGRCDG